MNLEHLQTFRSECELKFAIIRFYPTTKFQAEFTRMSWRDFLIIPPCYEMQRWMGGVKSSVYDSQLWTFSSSFSSHTIIQLNRINSYQDLVEVPLKVTILHRGWVCQHRQKGEHVNLVICLSLVSWFTGIWVCES